MNSNQDQTQGFNLEQLDKLHRQNLRETLEALREQLGSMRRIAASENFKQSLRDHARGLIPKILDEMRYTKEELEYEHRLAELEAN